MASSNELSTYERYITDGNPPFVVCMDDRNLLSPLTVEDSALSYISPYNQTAGGASGIGLDYMIVQEAMNPGSISESNVSRRIYTNYMALRFGHAGITLYNHVGCAAQLGEPDILETLHDNASSVADYLQESTPDIALSAYKIVAAAAGRIALKLPADDPKNALHEMETAAHTDDSRPVKTLPLEPVAHAGSDLIIDRRPNKVFDVRDANRDGNPAYFGSLGNVINNYKRAGINLPTDLLEATFLQRHGNIARNFLTSPDGAPLNILVANR